MTEDDEEENELLEDMDADEEAVGLACGTGGYSFELEPEPPERCPACGTPVSR
jgi:rubrerythrin